MDCKSYFGTFAFAYRLNDWPGRLIRAAILAIHPLFHFFHLPLFPLSGFSYFCLMHDPQNILPLPAFSLNIFRSSCTGFEPAPVTKADVVIREGEVPEALERIINSGVLYQSNDKEFLLRIDNVAAYYVSNGGEITVQRLGHASEGEVSAFLIGTSFGALMHQRRLLPLHACMLIYRDKGLLFAGISGAGKSTLAAALIGQGGILVADDISVIDFSGELPAVCPAFPYLKIWEDSLVHLGLPQLA
jgi:hypothetical protein